MYYYSKTCNIPLCSKNKIQTLVSKDQVSWGWATTYTFWAIVQWFTFYQVKNPLLSLTFFFFYSVTISRRCWAIWRSHHLHNYLWAMTEITLGLTLSIPFIRWSGLWPSPITWWLIFLCSFSFHITSPCWYLPSDL